MIGKPPKPLITHAAKIKIYRANRNLRLGIAESPALLRAIICPVRSVCEQNLLDPPGLSPGLRVPPLRLGALYNATSVIWNLNK
jgi:hypothetical protein